MRNKYPGYCIKCGAFVNIGDGYAERHINNWHVRCIKCVIENRPKKEKRKVEQYVKFYKKKHGKLPDWME